MNSDTSNIQWEGVLRKDATLDGQYLFAVKTTGIYCRPSCPSRTPKRSNVSFFLSSEQARLAGFRACLRCAPDGLSKREQQTQAILQACRIIDESEEKISLSSLASRVALSPHHFHRVFKEVTGVTPQDYFKARQIAQIGQSIKSTSTVTDAIYDAGFSSSGRFYESTNAMLGMTPKAYKAGGTGEAMFDDWLERVLRHIEASAKALDLPLDIRGTVFQQQVWKALQDIPVGATASYSEIAQRIDKPKAVRAVASACASNTLAVVIPCHRVVGGNGELSGYRWGVERKSKLLDIEAAKATLKSID
jgi:AraC family transcriptional regulator, regulatory protein of adaptative response / methylated-DNA-[protein]-cysteine methyltransferase